MLNLTVIRHAETRAESEHRTLGRVDEPLTESGIKAAHELAETLKIGGKHYDLILTSPLQRAAQTAANIGTVLNIPVEQELLLYERDFGELSGLTWEEFVNKYPELAKINQPQYQPNLPGGESIETVVNRVQQFLTNAGERYEGKNVVVVTHSGVIRILLRLAQGLTPETTRKLEIANLALFEIQIP